MDIASSTWVIFDGDDTLWQTTALYNASRIAFCDWLKKQLHDKDPNCATQSSEISTYQQNCDKELHTFLQYSASRFPRSFENTVRRFCADFDPDQLLRLIVNARKIGQSVFSKRAEPYAGAEQLLRSLKARGVRIGLLTAGDAWVQEKRVRDFPWSGLFNWIKIVSETEQDLAVGQQKEMELIGLKARYGRSQDRFLFIGDSLNSDVVPSVRADVHALWVAHPNWDKEQEHDGVEVTKDQDALEKRLVEEGLDCTKAALVERLDEIAPLLQLPAVNSNGTAQNAPIFAYSVLEGGGAKGLAYVGSLKACEQRNVVFLGIAGTSSGSIIAGLMAAGYSADELFNDDAGLLRTGNYPDILGPEDYETSKTLAGVVGEFSKSFGKGAWSALLNSSTVARTVRKKGAIDTSAFRRWYNECLSQKLFPDQPIKEITFAMIGAAYLARLKLHLNRRIQLESICAKNGCPLKIVATDVNGRAVAVYPDDGNEQMAVADAVAASMAIPFVFQPKPLDVDGAMHRHVDGGALANFPVWSLQNRVARFGEVVPILGFRLDDKVRGQATNSFYGYLSELVTTVIAGSARIATRGAEDFYEVLLPITASSFAFDMSDATKVVTVNEGLEATKSFFISTDASMLVTQEQMEPRLAQIHSSMISVLGRPNAHLRVNVMARRPPSRKLHVRYSYNMEFDSDDHLEFDQDLGGGVGLCWKTRETRPFDLVDARTTFGEYNMTKYEQALIRRGLNSLLCVPMFDPRDRLETKLSHKRLLGVLNFDSDDDLLTEFMREDVKEFADRQAVDLALYWIELMYTGAKQ